MSVTKRNFKTGFTLVELLVTISIFAILTGVVLYNQAKFNSSILLTNLAYDTALTIRQAQTFGINIKEFNLGGATSKFVPYGVHFDINNPKSFILFADLSYDINIDTGSGLYDSSKNADLTKCQNDRGCVSRYNIVRGNSIYALCVNATSDSDGVCDKKQLDIVFQRPNPDAYIRVDNSGTLYSDATIIIRGVDGVSERKIKVRSTGLIEITH